MGGNMAFGPLRTKVPRSPAGSTPDTARSASLRSSATGAKVPWSQGFDGAGSVVASEIAVMGAR